MAKSTTSATQGAPFELGEHIVLIDNRQRRYLVDLEENGEFHSHAGVVPHNEIIGSSEGT